MQLLKNTYKNIVCVYFTITYTGNKHTSTLRLSGRIIQFVTFNTWFGIRLPIKWWRRRFLLPLLFSSPVRGSIWLAKNEPVIQRSPDLHVALHCEW